MIGQTLGDRYRIDSEIGHGGFGIVYGCTDLSLKRFVAVKVLSSENADEKELKRFVSEAEHLASLNHPNVVHVYDFNHVGTAPYIVMEFLEGTTLSDQIARERLPLPRGLEIMAQVAAGLDAIHQRGLIHRDVSPRNIMVLTDGRTKVLDLGLAKNLEIYSATSATGYLPGTLPYVAPELIEGVTPTRAADVFSFGVLLYQVVTGVHPFMAEHFMAILYNISHRRPLALGEYFLQPPIGLADVIELCLEKEPQQRTTSMGEVAAKLEGVLKALETHEWTETSLRRLSPVPAAESSSRNPYLNRAMIRNYADFVGRRQEVRRIFSRLNANPPGSISIVGDRRIGKSSLLNHVYLRQTRGELLEQPGRMLMVFLDFQGQKDVTIELFVRQLVMLCQSELKGRMDVSGVGDDLDGVKKLVHRLHEEGYRLTIILDEFEAVTSNPNFSLEFYSFLRFLANHYNVAYLTSSTKDLQILCHTKEISDSPFFNIFTTMRIAAFSREEALGLITNPSAASGHPLAAHAEEIFRLAGYFPFFLQIACAHAVDDLQEHPDRATPDFKEVARHFYEEASLHYRFLWLHLEEHERSAIRRIATGRVIPESLGYILQELEKRGLIRGTGKTPQLFADSFQEFVQREEKPSGDSWFSRIWGRG